MTIEVRELTEFEAARLESAIANETNIDQSTVDDVVEHVRVMAEKYGFTLDKDCVQDCVEDSANLLGHSLTEEGIAAACDRVLNKA